MTDPLKTDPGAIVLPANIRDLLRETAQRASAAATLPYLSPAQADLVMDWAKPASECLHFLAGMLAALVDEATPAGSGEGAAVPEQYRSVGRLRSWVAPIGQWCMVVDEAEPDMLNRNAAALAGMAQAMGGIGAVGVTGSLDIEESARTDVVDAALIATAAPAPGVAVFAERLRAMAAEVARAAAEDRAAGKPTGHVCPLSTVDGAPFLCGCGPDGHAVCASAAASQEQKATPAAPPDLQVVDEPEHAGQTASEVDGGDGPDEPTPDDQRAADEMAEDAEDPHAADGSNYPGDPSRRTEDQP